MVAVPTKGDSGYSTENIRFSNHPGLVYWVHTRPNTPTMLTLYVKTGCPYCGKVLTEAALLGVTFDERNIADEGVAEELIARGGKQQVPYLVDTERNREMYESDDIVAYLREITEAS